MLEKIPIDQLTVQAYSLFENQWLLLTSGDFATGQYNAMTVAWGSLGCMWSRPFAMIAVRPTRYTYEFTEKFETFTLCAFPESQREALRLLGTRSGRDSDKIALSGLTPVAARQVAAPAFAEAELVIECQKFYWDDIDPAHFLEPRLDKNYPGKDYHRIYFGEILAVQGTSAYQSLYTGPRES